MTMSTTNELSGFVPNLVREGTDFTLYRGRRHGNPSPLLAAGLATEQSSPQSLRRERDRRRTESREDSVERDG